MLEDKRSLQEASVFLRLVGSPLSHSFWNFLPGPAPRKAPARSLSSSILGWRSSLVPESQQPALMNATRPFVRFPSAPLSSYATTPDWKDGSGLSFRISVPAAVKTHRNAPSQTPRGAPKGLVFRSCVTFPTFLQKVGKPGGNWRLHSPLSALEGSC